MSSTGVGEKVLRVNQLDAKELDEELSSLLQDQLLNVLACLPPTGILAKLKPELRAMLRLVLWKYSLYSRGRSFGQDMMDLSYATIVKGGSALGLKRKCALLFIGVFTVWLRERVHLLAHLGMGVHPSVAEKWLTFSLTIVNSLSLLNFIAFLFHGRFPSLSERILGLKMVPRHPQSMQQMSYDYMNREILWHGFYEFIFFVLPHFNLFAVKNWLRRMFAPKTGQIVTTPTAEDFLRCAFCEMPPTMPYAAGCGHVYCYYCLRANCLADSKFPCSTCGVAVCSWQPASFHPSADSDTL